MKAILDRSISLKNAINNQDYLLQPIYKLSNIESNLKEVATICNQELVYEWCFKELCKGAPYPLKMASEWIQWGTEGWTNQTHFVYAIVDKHSKIAAACDIKSANLERAEVGYWSSIAHRGIMTNATKALVELADEAGFQTLFADIDTKNKKSISVIERCAFLEVGPSTKTKGHTSYKRINPSRSKYGSTHSIPK